MKKWVDYVKQHRAAIYLIQAGLCMVLLLVLMSQKKLMQTIYPSEGVFYAGQAGSDGEAYIDKSSEFGGAFLQLESIPLKSGTYKIYVEYETDYDDNGFNVYSTNGNYGAINEDIGDENRPVSLKSFHNRQMIHAWMKREGCLQIVMRYCGAGYLKINRVDVERIPNYTPLFLLMLIFLFFDLEGYEGRRFSEAVCQQKRLARIGVVAITFAASIPLMTDYLIQGTDMTFHLYRIEGIAEGLKSGQFPVRIQPNWWNEFGYGTSLFYADFFLYIPAILTLIGYSLQTAYKLYIVLFHLLTAGVCYHCFRKITNDEQISLLGSMLYTLNIYRLMDIYMRGAVGEFTALTFLPLVVVGLYLIREKGSWIYLALGVTGCIQSHILTCEMLMVFLILFCIFAIKWIWDKAALLNIGKSILAAVGWNLWFVLPLLNVYRDPYQVKTGGTYVGAIQGRGAFVTELFKLFINGLVADKSASDGISGEMGHSIGLALGLSLALSVTLFYVYRSKAWKQKKSKNISYIGLLCTGFGLVALFMATNLFPYDALQSKIRFLSSLISHIQFPWRFLGFATLFATLSAVCSLVVWKNIEHSELVSGEDKITDIQKARNRNVPIVSFTALALGLLTLVGMSAFYHEMLSRDTVTARYFEYQAMAKVMDQTEYLLTGTDASNVDGKVIPSGEGVSIGIAQKEGSNLTVDCTNSSGQDGYIDLPMFFYPCYRAVDQASGMVLPIGYGENNRIRVSLPNGYQGTVLIKVRERMIWRLAELISFVSIVIPAGYAISKKLMRKKKEQTRLESRKAII